MRRGENCCNGDRLGTQGVGSTSEDHNMQQLLLEVGGGFAKQSIEGAMSGASPRSLPGLGLGPTPPPDQDLADFIVIFFSKNRSTWWSRTTGGSPEHYVNLTKLVE